MPITLSTPSLPVWKPRFTKSLPLMRSGKSDFTTLAMVSSAFVGPSGHSAMMTGRSRLCIRWRMNDVAIGASSPSLAGS